jgi:NADH dehydrogenase FAD-containing subunit
VSTPQVVVLGSGFAGLEAAFRLRWEVGEDVGITVVSDRDDFLFRPNTIYLPFGGAEERLHVPLGGAMRRRDIEHRIATVEGVDVDRGTVSLRGRRRLPYDKLVIATGADMRPSEVPGLGEHAHQVWTPAQMHQIGERLEWVVQQVRHGHPQRVLFVVPPNNKCAGPLYEIAFMFDTWLRRREARNGVDITFTTYEQSFIQAFGPKLHAVATMEFARRGIDAHADAVVQKVTETEVGYADGSTQGFDLLIAFPPYVAAVRYDGLPGDDRGFLRCHKASRTVLCHDEIYAPGDAGDFPVKQAYLALLQAGAVAQDIAAQVRQRPPKGGFEPVSMCVMEMLDRATFAQVPLRLTKDPAAPVAIDEDAAELYRVGTSAAWRLGKATLGHYLPMRFRHGRPFHAGLPWRGMQLGLRAGAASLAK